MLYVQKAITSLSTHLNKPITCLDVRSYSKTLLNQGVTQLHLYLPPGEHSAFEHLEKVLVFRDPLEQQMAKWPVHSFTAFYNSMKKASLHKSWVPLAPMELEAKETLDRYLPHVDRYHHLRTKIKSQTSALSPYMALGIVDPLQVYGALNLPPSEGLDQYKRQLAWVYYCKFKILKIQSLDSYDPKALNTWITGSMTHPELEVQEFLNSAMKDLHKGQLLSNRARLMVSYALMKHLNVYWEYGELYFRRALLDYHPAINRYNWYAQSRNRYLNSYGTPTQTPVNFFVFHSVSWTIQYCTKKNNKPPPNNQSKH
jgi:deoxyribodipyrimidine photolyase